MSKSQVMQKHYLGVIEDCHSDERHKEELVGLFQTKGNSLGSMLEDILGNKFNSKHGLFTG